MNKSNQIKLDELIVQSKKMYTDNDRETFSVKWWAFVKSLPPADAQIACRAYFAGIFETLDEIGKDVKDLVENGTEEERLEYAMLLEKLKEPLISAKLRQAA
jgi:hypothetical protein